MPDHRLLRGSGDFKGLDKRTSDLTRGIEYATDMKNATYRDSGAINKRKGFHKHILTAEQGSYGMYTYKNVNSTTGVVTDELLMVDTELRKLIDTTIDFKYSGSESMWYSMVLDEDTGTFRFKVLLAVQGEVVNKDLTGLTLATLKTYLESVTVDSTTPFTLTIPSAIPKTSTNGDLSPAEYMDIALNTALYSGGTSNNIAYRYWEAVTRGDDGESDTFAGYKRDSNNYLSSDDLTNATFAQMHDVLYISNGIDNIMKYDGSFVYRAGLPNPVITSTTPGSSGGSIAAGEYYYKVLYEFEDAKGNFIESTQITSSKVTVGSGEKVTIVLPYITSGGWNLDHQTNKLKIKVFRNALGGGLAGNFYEIDGATGYTSGGQVNVPGTANFTIVDSAADTTYATNALLTAEIKRRDPPPKGRYITTFKDCLVVSGQRDNVNNLQYSHPYNAATLVIGSESFPDDDNGKIIESSYGDKITAIASLRDVLYVFHTNSIHTLTGDVTDMVSTDPTTVDLLTKEGSVGCQSHHSIQELRGELLFLSEAGLYGINTSGGLREVSGQIKSLFNTMDRLRARPNLSKKRAVSFNWTDQNLYIIQVPTEELDDGGELGSPSSYDVKCTTSDSVLVAYDYYRDAWLQWTNLDYTGGVALYNNKIFFNNRFKNSDSVISTELSSMSTEETTHDYNDHAAAIPFEYDTNWESLGEPTVPKKFLRLKVYSNDTDNTFESSGFQLGIALQKNYSSADIGTMIFDFDSSAQGGWGVAKWGEFGWGCSINRHFQSKLPTGKNTSLKVRFKNSEYNTNVLITNYELEVVAPFKTEMKE